MDSYLQTIGRLMTGIETELRQAGLWEDHAPSGEALSSTQPFCFDTLLFHQWLQWLFLPRMRCALRGDRHMPTTSAIFPYASDCLREHPGNGEPLLFLIRSLDELIGGAEIAGHAGSS